MNDQLWWYLCRSTGIVAIVLMVAALLWGFLFSARSTGTRRSPAWWLDLHNYLGGLALVFMVVHVLTAVVDPRSGIDLLQALVPHTADSARWAVTWGVLATYVTALVVLTSWPRRRFSRRVWRAVHLTSLAGVAAGLLHSFQLGSDAATSAFRVGLVACISLATYGASLRLFGVLGGARMRAPVR